MKKRFTEAQTIGFLREGGSGVAIKDLCRLSERRVLTVVRMSATPCGTFRPRIARGRFGRRSRYWRTATGGTGPG